MNETMQLIAARAPKAWWTPILVALLAFSASGALALVLVATILGEPSNFKTSSISGTLTALFGFVLALMFLIAYNKFINKRSLRALGFKKEHAISSYLAGFAAGAILVCAVLSIGYLFGAFEIRLTQHINPILVLASLLGFAIQSMTEEVICRSYLQQSVAIKTNMLTGILISAIFFTLAHVTNPGMSLVPLLNLFIFGLVFSFFYAVSDNVWFVSAAHSAWNFVMAVGFGIQVSGNRFITSIAETQVSGSELINGGSFGLEGSLITTAIGIVLIAYLSYFYTRRHSLLHN